MFADSQIVTGHPWGADLCWLIAVILFVVAAVYSVMTKAIVMALVSSALAFVSLGLLLL